MNKELIFSYFKKLEKSLRTSFLILTSIGTLFALFILSMELHTSLPITNGVIYSTIGLVELFLLVRLPKVGLVGFPIALILGYSLHTVQFLRDLQGYVGPQKD